MLSPVEIPIRSCWLSRRIRLSEESLNHSDSSFPSKGRSFTTVRRSRSGGTSHSALITAGTVSSNTRPCHLTSALAISKRLSRWSLWAIPYPSRTVVATDFIISR